MQMQVIGRLFLIQSQHQCVSSVLAVAATTSSASGLLSSVKSKTSFLSCISKNNAFKGIRPFTTTTTSDKVKDNFRNPYPYHLAVSILSRDKQIAVGKTSVKSQSETFRYYSSSCSGGEKVSKVLVMIRPKVFISRSDIPKCAIDLLKERCDIVKWNHPSPVPREYFIKNVHGVQAIFCLLTDKIDKEVLDRAGPTLKVIGTMSVGHEHIDLQQVKARGVQVGFTPDVLTDTTAETTIALLLAASRRLFEAHDEILNGGWGKSAWGPEYMCGQGLANSTVGIFGMGRIGKAIMDRLIPFKVSRFLYSGRSKKSDVAGADFVEFDTLCKESDFVIVACALTPETKEIFNKRAFSLMKPSAVFVNTSRGGVVQQDDLIAALKTKQIFSAGLDVMTPEPLPSDHELTKLKNCVIVPHIGSATIQSRNEMAMLTARNILAGLEGSPLPAQLC